METRKIRAQEGMLRL